MSRPARQHPTGFTLIEVLVVVIILAILAAIVIPQFSNASGSARVNTTFSLLQVLRGQLELYRIHHNDQYPALDQLWDSMTHRTDITGTVVSDGDFGPYLERPPRNPFTLSTTVTAPGEGDAQTGWEYDEATGRIHAVGFDEDAETFTPPGADD